MHFMKTLLAGAALCLTHFASAAPNPLSVHVLNLQDGLPSPEVVVTLEKRDGERWTLLNTGVTNDQGRITALFPQHAQLDKGT